MALTSRSLATPCGLDGVQPSRMIKNFSSTFSVPCAIWTPTRRHAFRNSLFTACPHCTDTRCSARPLFADCPFFTDLREMLQRKWGVSENFGAISLVSLQRVGG